MEIPRPDRVSLLRKHLFGIGALADNFGGFAVTALAYPIYNLTYGLSPALVGTVIFACRLWDAICNPMIGSASDNCRSRFGRRKPFMAGGALISGLLFPCLWWVSPASPELGKFAHFLGFGLLFFTGYAVYSIPFVSIGYELTPDYNERTKVVAFRVLYGGLAGLAMGWLYYLCQLPVFGGTTHGVRVVGIGVGLLIILTGLIPACFLEERYRRPSAQQPKIRLSAAIKATLSNKPALLLMLMILTMIIATQAVGDLGFYVSIYHVFAGDKVQAAMFRGFSGGIYFAATLMGVPLITKISTRIGKRGALYVCLGTALAGTLSKWWLYTPAFPALQLVTYGVVAVGQTSWWVIAYSMLAEVCDWDELQTGARREGMYSALLGLIQKGAISLSFLSAGLILQAVGFEAKLRIQSPDTIFKMRLLFVAVPTVLILATFPLVRHYPITESEAGRIRSELEKRRGSI